MYSVTGSDEHGFFQVLSRPHLLMDPVAMSIRPPTFERGQPIAIQPVGIWRMPVGFLDLMYVIKKHAVKVGVELERKHDRP